MADVAIRISKWKEMTEEQALDDDWDMIPTLTAYAKTRDFCQTLDAHRTQLEKLVSRHLGIGPADFVLLSQDHWVWGSFNICLPIDIKWTRRASTLPRQAILRFALPFRRGEEYSPSNVEEKLRCEAATYIWLRQYCPTIPVPRLLGIGIPAAQSFTAIENESTWHRAVWHFHRFCMWFQGHTLMPYFRHERTDSMSDLGYLLLEYVMDDEPLSSTWQQQREDEAHRNNLYRGLSNILLDLANIPLPRIGSWRLERQGTISLTNRPLLDLTMLWNRHKIPTGIPRDLTYTSAAPFIQDMLTYQEHRLRFQPNSILGRPDSVFQLSAFVALRAVLPVFWNQELERDAFVLTLPDLHQSNIFVDDDWNIVGVIDFECAPVQPQQMVNVPHWLSGKGIDELVGPALEEYKGLHDLFIDIVEEEEAARQCGHRFSRRLRDDWQSGRFWYNAALRSSNAFPLNFEQHIQPRFFSTFDPDVQGLSLMPLWGEDCEEFIAAKIRDKKQYEQRMRAMFAALSSVRHASPAIQTLSGTKNSHSMH